MFSYILVKPKKFLKKRTHPTKGESMSIFHLRTKSGIYSSDGWFDDDPMHTQLLNLIAFAFFPKLITFHLGIVMLGYDQTLLLLQSLEHPRRNDLIVG